MFNIVKEGDHLPDFNIPLVIKGKQVGVIEAIGFKDDDGAQRFVISGYLLHALENATNLVELLKVEGVHLGKP